MTSHTTPSIPITTVLPSLHHSPCYKSSNWGGAAAIGKQASHHCSAGFQHVSLLIGSLSGPCDRADWMLSCKKIKKDQKKTKKKAGSSKRGRWDGGCHWYRNGVGFCFSIFLQDVQLNSFSTIFKSCCREWAVSCVCVCVGLNSEAVPLSLLFWCLLRGSLGGVGGCAPVLRSLLYQGKNETVCRWEKSERRKCPSESWGNMVAEGGAASFTGDAQTKQTCFLGAAISAYHALLITCVCVCFCFFFLFREVCRNQHSRCALIAERQLPHCVFVEGREGHLLKLLQLYCRVFYYFFKFFFFKENACCQAGKNIPSKRMHLSS